MTQLTNPNVDLVIYKCIVQGDLSKFTASSNITKSGGGARDLRFSPASEFFPAFKRMFPKEENGILRGFFSWNDHAPTEVEIHPPTSSRPNEVRIARINECFPSNNIPTDSTDCILLLILDATGRVSPYFTSLESLKKDNWHPKIKYPIIDGINAIRSLKTTAMGYIDIKNGVNYTNERI